MSQVSISTVTPVYNGAQYLPDLVKALSNLKDTLAEAGNDIALVESIFIIDEAIDNSDEVLSMLEKEYDWLHVITLSRNFGQHPATIAGILHTSGDWIVTLDEDLQHNPADIPTLLQTVVQYHSDICYAHATTGTHKSIIKDGLARLFKFVIGKLLNNPNAKHFNSFRLIRGSLARATAAICRHETYFDVALGWFTKRVVTANIKLVDVRNQTTGDSGYSLWGLIRHAKRMIMSSRIKLLRLSIPIGVVAFLISIFISAYALISALLKISTTLNKGWASTILVVLFLGGLSILLISIILESLSDIMLSINGKPTYFVVDRSKDDDLKKALNKIKNETLSK